MYGDRITPERLEDLHKHAVSVADEAYILPRQERFAALSHLSKLALGFGEADIADLPRAEQRELLEVIGTARDILIGEEI